MVWQYLQIVIRSLLRYARIRFQYMMKGTLLMHRYQTAHILLSRTIELCEERRRVLVIKEREAAQKKLEAKQKMLKVDSDAKEVALEQQGD